ncbi:MarR family winged helix-turn-helix transcriptional regulator [Marinivivus vitaminiproducens]|uniref:MarR family winged helix-turn-helix transcriptional regulator n=1 Tax=Marinivivus vitaminiproducens TaxID=3035935 RepID=UPI0027A147A7|nr:MarR family transcriptional regulator [Geminicoccaceae bacterium SCSIO 64248]
MTRKQETLPRTDETAGLSSLDRFLCFAVYSTGLALTRAYKPYLDELGLTYPQYLVMMVLAQEDGQTVGALGDKLFLESNTLTPLIKRLEAMGYVTRTRDRTDERVVHVGLTGKGRARAEEAACLPEKILLAMGMSPSEFDRTLGSLTRMRDRLRKPDAGKRLPVSRDAAD